MLVTVGAMLLAEEVFLLCHGPNGEPVSKWDDVKAAVSGAVLTELAYLGRLSIGDERLPRANRYWSLRPVPRATDYSTTSSPAPGRVGPSRRIL